MIRISFVIERTVEFIKILEEDFPRHGLVTLFLRALSRVLV